MPDTVIRDYVPEGAEYTVEEKVRWSIDQPSVKPDFVPGEGQKTQPLGTAEQAAEDARKSVKAFNKAQHDEDAQFMRVEKMKSLTVREAVVHVNALSQFEKEQHLKAEQDGRNRSTVLSHFGWSKRK